MSKKMQTPKIPAHLEPLDQNWLSEEVYLREVLIEDRLIQWSESFSTKSFCET